MPEFEEIIKLSVFMECTAQMEPTAVKLKKTKKKNTGCYVEQIIQLTAGNWAKSKLATTQTSVI
jgi:hypothetical protein